MPNLQIIGIDEGEAFQVNGINQNLKKITDEDFPKPRKDTPIWIQEAHRTPNRQ